MNIDKYLNNKGTVLSDDLNKEIVPENTLLWSLQLFILAIKKSEGGITNLLYPSINDYFYSCIRENGYFKNIGLPDEQLLEKDRATSKDQLTAYSCWSLFIGSNHANIIAKQLKWFFYDGNFIHPKEYAALKIMGGQDTWYWRVIYVLTNLWTFRHGTKTRPKLIDCFKTLITKGVWPHRVSVQKTDGELLYWVTREYFGVISKGLDEYANKWIDERFGGWAGVHKKYFGRDHPITLLSEKAGDRV